MLPTKLSAFLIIVLSCFMLLRFTWGKLVQDEVDALKEITRTMGSIYWEFDADSCEVKMAGVTPVPPKNAEHSVECKCDNDNDTDCHVVKIVLKGLNLPGVLPSQLLKLPYLQEIDFAFNFLNGSIPHEWASMQLTSISLLVNRLSGKIPKELGDITTLIYLGLETNQFSGIMPSELGNLINLQTLMLSSNQLTGNLPKSFAGLVNLTDLRINDNNFSGTIPNFIQNWKKLTRLEMHGSGLEGPIPSSISLLNNLSELRFSDIKGPSQKFPNLSNITGIIRLVLRSCNISGELPAYIWEMENLEMLDVSFNMLVGKLPETITAGRLRFVFLTGNLLSGDVPECILRAGSNIDLSYNNFALQGPGQPACQENMNLNLNLYRSSSAFNNSWQLHSCAKSYECPEISSCFHVNSGGKDETINENKTSILYRGDVVAEGGTAKLYVNDHSYWGFSSTGDFMDDNDYQNTRYTVSLQSSNVSPLLSTARIAPISLTYFHYCLKNGKYLVKLHFAEIQFTDDKTYNSLGRRIFDIYVQERLERKDFNIEDVAGSAKKPLVLSVPDVNVTNNVLEIRFYFAGKGTTRVPNRGVYGPLVSAISVASDLKLCSNDEKSGTLIIIVGVIGALCLTLVAMGMFWWKCYLPRKWVKEQDQPTGTYSLKQIRAATDNFDPANKIGEGGFGPVYKGLLRDGTVIAVKQLSSISRQGNREFLNEIGMISCLQHPNLVKLHGFCVEGDQLLVVYEYMENNSLARALFDRKKNQLKLDWSARVKICTGIAKGLAFLHEESRLKIVHRDIKSTNVLLDRDLNPKISDFGLARLTEEEKSHVSTRVAGTVGYMAPEYALWGHLSDKADVYSFGVVALEIVSGKNNNDFLPSNHCVCLLDWACYLQQTGNFTELVDETLRCKFDAEEAETVVKVALICTSASATVRPTMSEVVNILEGRTPVPDTIPEPSSYAEDMRFKAIRDLRQHTQSTSESQTQNSTTVQTFDSCSTSDNEFYEINPKPES
ncbi:Leucine-rich repeat transmembrane protein kinase [Euphorbia peplus]|nr:Leucine-rich repeat transmembrane protein kinase [Euphorbia peplus]